MTRRPHALLPGLAVVLAACLEATGGFAVTGEAAAPPPIDAAPCLAAIAAADDDRIVSLCRDLIDSDKTAKADRLKALIARGNLYVRQDQLDRAIADYDAALRLDPSLADILNARGEVWRRKGDRVKALQDFGAALQLDAGHPAAKANYKSLALELERLGAQMAVAGKPSFDCARARRAVEKAICADPELADLDREIHTATVRALRAAARRQDVRALEREQDEFIAARNAGFGRPGYDLKKAMRERLDRLGAAAVH